MMVTQSCVNTTTKSYNCWDTLLSMCSNLGKYIDMYINGSISNILCGETNKMISYIAQLCHIYFWSISKVNTVERGLQIFLTSLYTSTFCFKT